MSTRRTRQGFSLVDLLMVIAIVGVLLAGLLSAVEQDREAARRQVCMNKMKQLGLAMHNHHGVYKRFPASSNQRNANGVASVWWPLPGSGADTGAAPSVGYTTDAGTAKATAGYSWAVMILPYMDEGPVYNRISQASRKFTIDAFTPFNVAGNEKGAEDQTFSITFTSKGQTFVKHFATIQFDELSCPSYAGTATVAPSQYKGMPAGNPPAAYGYPDGKNLGSPPALAAVTNYVALSATHFPCMQYGTEEKVATTTQIPADADAPNGMIVPGKGLNFKTCTDGTSKTLMLCETIEPSMNCWYDGTTTWTTGINPNSVGANPPSKADPLPSGAANPHHFWTEPIGGSTALNVGPTPTATTAYSAALDGYCATPQVISWGPSSNHPGGVVIHGSVDAAAHAITSDIDPTVYMRLITRAGGEPTAFPEP